MNYDGVMSNAANQSRSKRMKLALPGFAISAAFGLLCVSVVTIAHAQIVSMKPHFSGETRGRVVDADTGQPIEGAVVVGRWEWLTFIRTRSGGHNSNEGEAVHVGEALTDRDGRFAIPRWGPKVKASGEMADNVPTLLVFKSGYEPLRQESTAKDAPPIRLKKAMAEPMVYAQRIAEFQEGVGDAKDTRIWRNGLTWRRNEDAASMPRMILALHREKERLGPDGEKILGANMLPGRSGVGEIKDQSGQPVRVAAVWIEWTMRPADGGKGTRRIVQTKGGSDRGFWVSPWRVPGPKVAGWQVDLDAMPVVRVYGRGYKPSSDTAWSEQGGKFTITKYPETREGRLEELRVLRRDIDKGLATIGGQEGLALQRALLVLLSWQCNDLTPDLRKGVCFDEQSDVARYVQAANREPANFTEDEEGIRVRRVALVNANLPSPNAKAASPAGPNYPGPAGLAGQRPARPNRGIGGFRIEPAP